MKLGTKFGLLILLCSLPCFANQAAQGWCSIGGQVVVTQGLRSVGNFQASYPGCLVSVYYTGTSNLATIYSDNSNTALSNPFTASTQNGSWLWYAANGRYDVTISSGTIPQSILPSPFTFTDILLYDPSSTASNTCIQGAQYATLQAAVTAAGPNSCIFYGPGTYNWTPACVSLPNNIAIVGAGEDVTTFNFSGSPNCGFNEVGNSSIALANFTINSTSGALTQGIRSTNGATNIFEHDIKFTGSYTPDSVNSFVSGPIVHISGFTKAYIYRNNINITGATSPSGPNSVQGITLEQVDSNNPSSVHLSDNHVVTGSNTTGGIELFNCMDDCSSDNDYVNQGNSCWSVCANNGYPWLAYATAGNVPTNLKVTNLTVENGAGTGIYIQGYLDVQVKTAYCKNINQQQPNTSLVTGCLGILGSASGGKIDVEGIQADTSGTEGVTYAPQSTFAVANFSNIQVKNLTNSGHYGFWARGVNIGDLTVTGFKMMDTTAQWPFYSDSGGTMTLARSVLHCATTGVSTCVNIAGSVTQSHFDFLDMYGSNNACINDSGGSYNTEIGNTCNSPSSSGYVTSFTNSVFTGDSVKSPGSYGLILGMASARDIVSGLEATGSSSALGVIDEGAANSVINSILTGNSSGAYSCSGTGCYHSGNSWFGGTLQGQASLGTGGTVTVPTTEANSTGTDNYYFTNCGTASTTPGILSLSAIVSHTSFSITSTQSADRADVCWRIDH